jgi:triacylglycerol lipase
LKARAVLLVPGWGDRSRSLRHLRSYLISAGYSEECVHAIDFRSPFGSNIAHASELAAFIDQLPQAAEPSIDIVAHSMGGLAVRYLLGHVPGAARRIRRVVSLGSPHSGTIWAWLGWGEGAREMRPASDFLKALNRAGTAGADLVSIRAPFDLRILPGTSSILAGARNYQLRSIGHRDLLRRKSVLEQVRQLLEEP